MTNPVPVHKRGVTFFIDADAECPIKDRPRDWYLRWWTHNYKVWEGRTFVIFDTFLNPRRCYIDVGAWIGPTVLYAAAKARHVYCLEPDPEAYRVLSLNLSVNPQYRNITSLNSALSDVDGYAALTAARELGLSESTILVQKGRSSAQSGVSAHTADAPLHDVRNPVVVLVPAMTMETLEKEYTLTDCSFMKMDIEGGEKIVLPAIAPFLRRQRPALYLSLHWGPLSQADVESILDLLATIYGFMYDDSLSGLDRRRVVDERIASIVCTASPLTTRQRLAARRMILFQRVWRILQLPFRQRGSRPAH